MDKWPKGCGKTVNSGGGWINTAPTNECPVWDGEMDIVIRGNFGGWLACGDSPVEIANKNWHLYCEDCLEEILAREGYIW